MLQAGENAETRTKPTSSNYVIADHFAWENHLVKMMLDHRMANWGATVINMTYAKQPDTHNHLHLILCLSANKQ